MLPRNMQIDFTDAPIAWSENKPYATVTNSGSPAASAFEPYLNKVMARARDALAGRDPIVHHDINLFIAQEGHHYRVHKAFNKILYARYPKLKEFEIELTEALRMQFETHSLAYNLAYCTGFENFACYSAKFAFTKGLPLFEGAENRVATLWRWHLAEEFEHRSACNDAFNAVSGNYFVRMRGFFLYFRTTLAWQTRVISYMFEVDRASMTPAEQTEFTLQKKRNDREFLTYLLPRMAMVLLPFYNAARHKAPPALSKALDEFTQMAQQRQPLASSST